MLYPLSYEGGEARAWHEDGSGRLRRRPEGTGWPRAARSVLAPGPTGTTVRTSFDRPPG